MTTSRGLLLFTTDIDPAMEEEFHRWYEDEHIPERMAVPGFLTARRFRAIEGGPKYLALYDLESPEVLASEPYLRLTGDNKSAWPPGVQETGEAAAGGSVPCGGAPPGGGGGEPIALVNRHLDDAAFHHRK